MIVLKYNGYQLDYNDIDGYTSEIKGEKTSFQSAKDWRRAVDKATRTRRKIKED